MDHDRSFMEENEFSPEDKSNKRRTSVWRIIDILTACFALFNGIIFCSFTHYSFITLLSFPVIIVLVAGRGLYEKDRVRTTAFRVVTTVLRVTGYTVLAVSLFMCVSCRLNLKFDYPLQLKICKSNFSNMGDFFPEQLPEKAEDYSFFFVKGPFPGISRAELRFFTDQETIEEYRQRALSRGMKKKENVGARWESEMREAGVYSENAETYESSNSSEHFPKVYVLDEESGFVLMYF